MENLDPRLIELMDKMDNRLSNNYDISDLIEEYNILFKQVFRHEEVDSANPMSD